MSEIKLSDNQRLAIDTRNKNILVSAAAGAGKTFVLVQRVIKLITEKNHIDIDSLLIVTYTNAAAAEMRAKIRKALNEELDKNKNANLIRQSLLLNKASICTIDAFCNNLVRNNFHKINIDPSYRILSDETEKNDIKNKIIDEMFNEHYKNNDADFIRLVDTYCNNFSDKNIITMILEIYDAAMNSTYPKKWLEMCRKNYSDTFYNTPVGKCVKEKIKANVDIIRNIYNRVCNANVSAAITKKINAMRDIVDLFDTTPLEDITDLPSITYLTKPQIKSLVDMPEFCTDMDSVVAALDEIKQLLIDTDENDEITNNLKPLVNTLIDITEEFSERYMQRKTELKAFEFSDISHFALEILQDKDGNPTDIANNLREKYNEIIIDEYQDTSDIQEEIFKTFSRKNNLFMVGDIKQSIYRFRKANPALFKEKYDRYKGSDENSVLIPLFENYRSKSCVIDFCNAIFSQIMRNEFGGINYNDPGIPLKSTDKNPEIYNKTDIYILQNIPAVDTLPEDLLGLSSIEYESNFIADKVKGFLESPDIQPQDIAILVSEKKSVIYPLLTAFAQRGIPAFFDSESTLIDALEIQTIISLLKIIDNPYDNIPVITILHSHIYNISDSDLARIKLSYDSSLFYRCVEEYARNNNDELSKRLNRFLKDILDFRLYSFNNKLSLLLNYIYNKTDYYLYVSILPNGNQRQANLLQFKEIAESYESYSSKSLHMFIDYIENSNQKNQAVISDGSLSSVTIYTMHKSKGLEFNIVILGFLGKSLLHTIPYPSPTIHQDWGFTLKYIKDEHIRLEAPMEKMFKYFTKNEDLSEKLRLLYVALTRAKQKLILTGMMSTAKKYDESKAYPHHHPYKLCRGSQKFIEWITACNISGNIAEKHFIDFDPNIMYFENNIEKSVNALENIEALENMDISNDTYSNITKKLDYVYENAKAQDLPAKLSISEIKRINAANTQSEENVNYYESKIASAVKCPIPDFTQSEKAVINGAKVGTIYHCIFEHLDFKTVKTKEDIVKSIDEFIDSGIITKEEAKLIKISKLESFINSNLYKRLQKSNNIYKETSFMMEMNGYEIFGDEYRDANSKIVVHGIIDLYFIEDNEIVLVDYKTDRIKNHNVNELIDKYKVQLESYKKALELNTGMKVKESIIYSVYENMEVLCK